MKELGWKRFAIVYGDKVRFVSGSHKKFVLEDFRRENPDIDPMDIIVKELSE